VHVSAGDSGPLHLRLPDFLAAAAEAIGALPFDASDLLTRLDELRERFVERRFHLAVLGQFKRGKSTLINALLGEEILPSAVVPLTAIPTMILAGTERAARVTYLDGSPDRLHLSLSCAALLAVAESLVTETGNPANAQSVKTVEIMHPSPFLQDGLVLVDTPGIGSTLAHNTETTLDFLPKCDAALFVLSADPPVTEVEAEFLVAVGHAVEHIYIVMNKRDYLEAEDLAAILRHLRQVLERHDKLASLDPRIFAVSARDGLRAKIAGDQDAWVASGMDVLEDELLRLQLQDQDSMLLAALGSKATRVIEEALARAVLMRRSLQLSLSELEQRLAVFERLVDQVDVARQVALDGLEGDRRRVISHLENQAEVLRRRLHEQLWDVALTALVEHSDPWDGETAAEAAISKAIPSLLDDELRAMASELADRVDQALAPHQARVRDLLKQINKAAEAAFDLPEMGEAPAATFALEREPYWILRDCRTALTVVPPQVVDRLLPRHMQMARIKRRLNEQIDGLVIRNVENLRWPTLQSLQAIFQRFASQYEHYISDVIRLSKSAVVRARDLRLEGEAAVGPGLAALTMGTDALHALLQDGGEINQGDGPSC